MRPQTRVLPAPAGTCQHCPEGWVEDVACGESSIPKLQPAFQDDVVATYSFNNHSLLRFHEAIKDAIDPNGILAAGRYGIWPKAMRAKRA